ncbi:type II toxin-antitoxin system RelE/ParE family toxin [Nostoc sp. NIES-2111]
MSKARYIIRPKADQDLDDQAFYYATEACPELGHRFLVSAHETFSLLSTQPEMGWNPKLRLAEGEGLRLFRVTGFEKILILYRPIHNVVEILRVVHGSQNIRKLLRTQGIE